MAQALEAMDSIYPPQLFYIQKKGLCFIVDVNDWRVLIHEGKNSNSSSPALSLSVHHNLILLAEHHLKYIPAQERANVLMNYFTERDWTVSSYLPKLTVSKSGRLQSTI